MDAFSPPLERHLDNLAKTVKAVLKRPALAAANVPAQPERPSIPTPPIRPSWRKSILIAVTIAALVIVGGAGWYLVQKEKGPLEKPAVTPIETSTPVPITPAVTPTVTTTPVPVTPAAAAPVPTLVPIAVHDFNDATTTTADKLCSGGPERSTHRSRRGEHVFGSGGIFRSDISITVWADGSR